MEKFPFISIITVTFNASSTLEETILSVINQTYSNIEYIIVDGASNDSTIDIIKKYANKISYWISEPDKGIYDAMNKGLQVANGKWCLFLGADDLLFSNTIIEEISNYLLIDENVYYGNVLFKNSKEIYTGAIKSAYQLCMKNICHQSIFYPKCIYKNKKYNLKYKIYADYVYNLELYGNKSSSFSYINKIISIYNESGISAFGDKDFENDKWNIIKRLFGFKLYLILWIKNYIIKLLIQLRNILTL